MAYRDQLEAVAARADALERELRETLAARDVDRLRVEELERALAAVRQELAEARVQLGRVAPLVAPGPGSVRRLAWLAILTAMLLVAVAALLFRSGAATTRPPPRPQVVVRPVEVPPVPSRSPPTPPAAEESGRLTRSQIQAVMAQAREPIQACPRPDRAETLVIKLTIDPSGKVTDAVAQGALVDTATARCVLGVIRARSFPAFTGGPVNVLYPFAMR